MTLEYQIRDEKLQNDINREAAKISALSSGKTDKYEYLTGEEILPSNQQQILEHAKFTSSPLGKAFEKQINTYGDYFIDRLAKIRKSYKPIDFKDLTYNFKDLRIPSVGFITFKGPLHIFKSIHNGDTPL